MTGPNTPPRFAPHTFMLLPTLACQASCRYCFAPHESGVMRMDTLRAAVATIDRVSSVRQEIRVELHGGEPLLAGAAFYREALPLLRDTLGESAHLGIQSNLWALDTALLDLLARYRVGFGTSLDGPEDICDAQRGAGYFARTLRGIRLLQAAGIPVSVIATVARQHVGDVPRIMAFFQQEGLPYTLRGVTRPFAGGAGETALDRTDSALFYETALQTLAEHPCAGPVRDIQATVAGVFHRRADLCTFSGCLGRFLAIAPDGSLYACQRFCNAPGFCMGNAHAHPDAESIQQSEGYRRLAALEANAAESCGDCRHFDYCHGGCLYARAVAASRSEAPPHCGWEAPAAPDYATLFSTLDVRLAQEMADCLQAGTAPTPYLQMAGDRPQPAIAAQAKRMFVQAVRWGETGLPRHAFYAKKHRQEVFLNITQRCPLRCTHCGVSAGPDGVEMPLSLALQVAQDAVALGYETLSLNGGEPLTYGALPALLEGLARLNRRHTSLRLNTNLYPAFDDALADLMLAVHDEIVISVDGDEAAHDARRGPGTFARTCENIRRLVARKGRAKLSLRATLTDAQRADGTHARMETLARELGVTSLYRARVLPIGRAGALLDGCHIQTPLADEAFFAQPSAPRDGCGVGERLHVAPSGVIYPCWGRMQPGDALGHAADGLLPATQKCEQWIPVDREPRCQGCRFRYVCGGLCRAYGDVDCATRRERLETLLAIAQR